MFLGRINLFLNIIIKSSGKIKARLTIVFSAHFTQGTYLKTVESKTNPPIIDGLVHSCLITVELNELIDSLIFSDVKMVNMLNMVKMVNIIKLVNMVNLVNSRLSLQEVRLFENSGMPTVH